MSVHSNQDGFVLQLAHWMIFESALPIQDLLLNGLKKRGFHLSEHEENLLCVTLSSEALQKESKRHKFSDLNHKVDLTSSDICRLNQYALHSMEVPMSAKGESSFEVHVRQGKWKHVVRLKQGENLLFGLQAAGVIEQMFPLHLPEMRQNIWRKMAMHKIENPIHEIRDYFGSKIALYFAWLDHYTLWLALPAIVSALIYFFLTRNSDVDNAFVPTYSFFMIFWSTLFIKFWKRKQVSYIHHWGLLNHQTEEFRMPSFHGEERISLITGKKDLFFPHRKRYLRYGVTIPVTAFMLLVATTTMICCLNMNGYIRPDSPVYIPKLNSRNPGYYSFFLFSFFFFFFFSTPDRKPGMVYEDDPMVIQMLPSILHSLLIFLLNTMYSKIARALTTWENYKTVAEFERALILKRLPFEMFDCYLVLFYLAFWQKNIHRLRIDLMGLFITDTIRRIVVESVIPYITNLARSRQTKGISRIAQIKKEMNMDPLEEFDDWIEMVIQFGYIVLFSAAFPFAAFLGFLANTIEVRQDAFKLCFAVQRPSARSATSIGIWQSVLEFLSKFAVLTNCAIIGYTSNQVSYFLGDNDSIFGDSTATSLIVIFGLEHCIILMTYLLEYLVSDVPSRVKLQVQRENYQREKAFNKHLKVA